MNQNQINQVKGQIEAFSAIKISEIVASKYGNSADISTILIGEYSAKEYISTVKKVFAQFKEEIDGVYAKAMPFQYNFQNEHGNGNLHQDLSNLLNQINTHNFPASIPSLNKLIHYQAINGFWEKSKRKYFRTSEINLQEDINRVDLVSKHIDEVSKRLIDLVSDIDEEKNDLVKFIKSKGNELSEIDSLVTSARQHIDEISNIHTKAATLEERLSSLLEQVAEKKVSVYEVGNEIKSLLSELSELLNDSKSENQLNEKEYIKLTSSFNDKLSFVEDKTSYFEERNQYLNDLIEREVGASLFETFKTRKTELTKSILFWKYAVPVVGVATIGWISYLFGSLDFSGLPWQFILINSLKVLPAAGLLLFSISQYVKERNFQEEYAFKSAVALTINSYADQIQKSESKDKIIMDSVTKIYTSPIYQKTDNKSSDTLSSTVKDLIDAIKSIPPSK